MKRPSRHEITWPPDTGLWGRVGHDLRQPIQALLLLSHTLAASDDAASRRNTGHAMETALIALQDMLDAVDLLARLETGMARISRAPCDLPRVISRAAATFHEQGGDRLTIGALRGPLSIVTDVNLLALALVTLAHNAAKQRTIGSMAMASHRHRIGVRLAMSFKGTAPLPTPSLFIEPPLAPLCSHQRGTDGAATGKAQTSVAPEPGRIALGLALLARLAVHLGGRLEAAELPDGMRELSLVLPTTLVA